MSPRLETASGQPLGLSLALRAGERAVVDEALDDLDELGIGHLRIPIPVELWRSAEGRSWLEWLVPTLAGRHELLPSLQADEAPDCASIVAEFADALGDHFEHVELTDARQDILLRAADGLYHLGRKPILGLREPRRLPVTADRFSAIGVQFLPESNPHWAGWPNTLATLHNGASHPELWITETGRSTWQRDARGQVEAFLEAWQAPATRVYWHGGRDGTQPDHGNPRLNRLGLRDEAGRPKLLYRLLAEGGIDRVREVVQTLRRPIAASRDRATLITGGAGFIGSNVADRLLHEGRRVIVFDNLSRPGTEQNLRWLAERHPERLDFHLADVRDRRAVSEALTRVDQVFHFAAQVAVTTSLDDPFDDFEINARGTLNLLEAIRRLDDPPTLLFTSTNKVYGGLDNVPLVATETRYQPEDLTVRSTGIDEERPLEFCSPYGCSKGAADQYVLDYARTFGIPAAVFRMSCIYGPRQFGNEDQGWVAHFLIQALRDAPITIYGDGRQVRDVLFVDDLVEAMLTAQERMGELRGRAFNIGGGPENTLSLHRLLEMITTIQDRPPAVRYQEWRASDQRYYVSDTSRFTRATGWQPATSAADGVVRLYRWLAAQHGTGTGDEQRAAL